jgi:hypothetical protein
LSAHILRVHLNNQDDESDFEDDFELAEQELYRSDDDSEEEDQEDDYVDDDGNGYGARESGKGIRFSDFFAADDSSKAKKRQKKVLLCYKVIVLFRC